MDGFCNHFTYIVGGIPADISAQRFLIRLMHILNFGVVRAVYVMFKDVPQFMRDKALRGRLFASNEPALLCVAPISVRYPTGI